MTPEPLSLHMSAVALMREPAGVLMVESSYPGYTDTFWAMPGGMLERGESMVDALAREVREETGLEIAGPCRIAAVIWLLTSEGAPHGLRSFANQVRGLVPFRLRTRTP